MPFTFCFAFFMSVYYSSASESVVYIFVVHDLFWLLCHIYLAASSFCICSSHRAGELERMDGVPDCSHGWHTVTSKILLYSFVCLTNHVGQLKQPTKHASALPSGCCPPMCLLYDKYCTEYEKKSSVPKCNI